MIGLVLITQYSYGIHTEANLSNNVIERYKTWNAEEVRADLNPNRTELVTVFQNIEYNINIACAIRSNNAFLGKEAYIVGRRKFDPRGAVGCKKYERVLHADTLQEVVDKLHTEGYTIYAADNQMEYNPVNLWDEDFPRKSAFVFGEEQRGLSKEEIELCDKMIYVAMYGSVRSLNVASCATVIMAEYSRRYR